MIRHPLLAAALALAAFLAACALSYVTGPLADTGAGFLPMVAAVAIATAVAGAGWGLLAFGLGAAFMMLFFMPANAAPLPSNPTLQLIVAVYTISALLVLMTISALRVRLARLGEASTDRPNILIASDGSEHAAVPLKAPVPAPNGDDGRVILLRDAGAWQRTQEELRTLIAELLAANRQKDEAIAALTAGGVARAVVAEHSSAPESVGERCRAAPPVPSDLDTQPDDDIVAASPEHRVLMLCDDSENAFALSMLLGIAGYEVKTAASAPEALHHAAHFAPQVALIDTTLDDTGGLAAAKALRSVCAGLDLVALTNPGETHDAQELAAAGYVIAVPKTEPLRLKRWLATRRAA